MKIRVDPPGAPKGPDSTTEAKIDLAFRPREIEKVLMHVGREARAEGESEVRLRFRGELVVDFDPHQGGDEDVLGMTLNLSLEEKP